MVAVGRQSLDRQDRVAVRLYGQHEARADRRSVEDHRAGAANAMFAAHVGAGEQQIMAQEVT
jgi:hypothetical protein